MEASLLQTIQDQMKNIDVELQQPVEKPRLKIKPKPINGPSPNQKQLRRALRSIGQVRI